VHTKYFHEKSTCGLEWAKNTKKNSAKNKFFRETCFILFTSTTKISNFREFAQTDIDCQGVHGKKLLEFFDK
jgi:hypothetical protein